MFKIQRLISKGRKFGIKSLFQCRNQLFRRYLSQAHDRRLPNIYYLQSPYNWLRCKYRFQLLKHAWDLEFCEREFKRGATQACFKVVRLIRIDDLEPTRKFTTQKGFNQILMDMVESQNDPRLSLLLFRKGNFSKVVPVNVHFLEKKGARHCQIDVFFLAMRYVDDILYHAANCNDKFSQNDLQLIENLKKIEMEMQVSVKFKYPTNVSLSDKVLMAEFFMRFQRNYPKGEDWLVEYFKVVDFRLLHHPTNSK